MSRSSFWPRARPWRRARLRSLRKLVDVAGAGGDRQGPSVMLGHQQHVLLAAGIGDQAAKAAGSTKRSLSPFGEKP
jgi:hypothetical protein